MQRVHRFTVIVGIILFAAGSAWAVDGQIKIAQTASTTFPIVINKAGSYVLTSNLVVTDPNVNAITIEVNDVTLDLNGHKIQGPNTGAGTGSGIYAYTKFTIAIKNGRVWGFGSYGINLLSEAGHPSVEGAGHMLDKIQVANNEYGIGVNGGIVTNCTSNNNRSHGFYIFNSSVINCIANNNSGGSGFQAWNSTITNCSAIKNFYGFNANESTITNCTSNYNLDDGFNLNVSTLTNCTAHGNGSTGIYANTDGTVTNCTASYNNGDGIRNLFRAIIKGCLVTFNEGYGIIIVNSNQGSYVYRNAARANTLGQISCASGNTCIDNSN